MQNKNAINHGFTLVELLIVVLIIGVLVSIALPMYQGAVDKSRWAKLLSPSRTIANAEEAILMSQGKYTTEKDDLSISLPDDGEYTYTLYSVENGDDGNFVRLESDKLEDVRLKRYYTQDENYPEMLFCEALSTNARANALCEKRLQGSQLGGSTDDGYKSYLLGTINVGDSVGCGKMHWFWSITQNTCYTKESDRCTANGAGWTWDPATQQCQSTDGSGTFGDGNVCVGSSIYGCGDIILEDGGICYGNKSQACRYITANGGKCIANAGAACSLNSNYYSGSMCIGNVGQSCAGGSTVFHTGSVCVGKAEHACGSYAGTLAVFETGSRCVAVESGACQGNYQGGCCEGPYCGSKPSCADSLYTEYYTQQ